MIPNKSQQNFNARSWVRV